MSRRVDPPPARFEPIRPASRGVRIAAYIFGPLIWLVALVVAALLLKHTSAIELGLLVTIAAFVVAFVVLLLIRQGRERERERYAARG